MSEGGREGEREVRREGERERGIENRQLSERKREGGLSKADKCSLCYSEYKHNQSRLFTII